MPEGLRDFTVQGKRQVQTQIAVRQDVLQATEGPAKVSWGHHNPGMDERKSSFRLHLSRALKEARS